MADPITNTYVVSTDTDPPEGSTLPGYTQGVREDLYDIITRIDPAEVPVYTMAKKTGASNIQFDWLVQELMDPDATNNNPEGFDADFPALKKPDRLVNVCQILKKSWIVSNTMDAVNKAGRSREYSYQQIMKGLEIRRDLETIITGDQVKNLAAANRLLSSFSAYLPNASVGAGLGVPATGDGTDVHTPGTLRALTLTLIDDSLEIAYTEGGNPSTMVMHPKVRRKFSKLPGINSNETNLGSSARPAVTIGTVAVYLSDFGLMDVVMDRFMPSNRVYCIDKRFLEVCNLPGRAWSNTRLAVTGDAQKGLIVFEGSLRVLAPKAHGVVHDIDPALDPA